MELQVIKSEHDIRDMFRAVVDKVNVAFSGIKTRNPHGFLDQFEASQDTIFADAVSGLGGKFFMDSKGRYFADFSGMVNLESFAASHQLNKAGS